MNIKNRRTKLGWSQEDLARHSGLSARTIQRIEAGQKAGLESLKSLAAVFEVTVSELVQEQSAKDTKQEHQTPLINEVEREAIDFAQSIIGAPEQGQSDPLTRTERAALNYARSLLKKFKV